MSSELIFKAELLIEHLILMDKQSVIEMSTLRKT